MRIKVGTRDQNFEDFRTPFMKHSFNCDTSINYVAFASWYNNKASFKYQMPFGNKSKKFDVRKDIENI